MLAIAAPTIAITIIFFIFNMVTLKSDTSGFSSVGASVISGIGVTVGVTSSVGVGTVVGVAVGSAASGGVGVAVANTAKGVRRIFNRLVFGWLFPRGKKG